MQLLNLSILIATMAVFAGLALFIASRPLAGAILVIAAYLYGVQVVTTPPTSLGFLIYPANIVFVLLFVALTLRYMMGITKLKGVRWIPFVLLMLFFIGVARGLGPYGLKEVGNTSRTWFYFLTGILYFSSFNLSMQLLKKVTTTWMVASMALVGLAIFRWIATAAGFGIAAQWEDIISGNRFRVVQADDAFVLAIAFFASLFMNLSNKGPHWQRKAFYLLGPILLLLQHRTVWIVMIIGLLWLGLHDARFRKRAIGATAGMAIVGILMTVFLFSHQSETVTLALQSSASNEDTFLWRVDGWYELLFNNSSMTKFNATIGQPAGTGYERVILGSLVTVEPHNYYVEAFLRLGAVGLSLLIWLYALGMRRMKKLPIQLHKYIYPDRRFWMLTLILQLVYFFAYGAHFEQSILTGIAIAGIRLRLDRSAPKPLTVPEPPCALS